VRACVRAACNRRIQSIKYDHDYSYNDGCNTVTLTDRYTATITSIPVLLHLFLSQVVHVTLLCNVSGASKNGMLFMALRISNIIGIGTPAKACVGACVHVTVGGDHYLLIVHSPKTLVCSA
jgi:hypothetical protein